MQITEIEIDKLIPYEFNNKVHDETQVNRIANSIKEFGFLQPIVIDKDNIVIVGHGRLEGAKKLGLKKVPCVKAESLTEAQIKKYRILDNKLNESEYDLVNLKAELEELDNLNIGELELSKSELFGDIKELWADEYGEEFELPNGSKSKLGQITFTLADEQKEEVEEAIKLVKETDIYKSQMNYGNENSNGNALACIIEQWILQNK